jgi:hypothetical protein
MSPPFWSSLAAFENVTGVSVTVHGEMETGQHEVAVKSRPGRLSATTDRERFQPDAGDGSIGQQEIDHVAVDAGGIPEASTDPSSFTVSVALSA